MSQDCCKHCCLNPPTHLRMRVVSGGCGPIQPGFTICLTLDATRACDFSDCAGDGVFRYTWSGSICGIASSTELLCCRKDCLHGCWQLGSPGRTIFFAETQPRADWNCEPFFIHWDNVRWEGTVECFAGGAGVPFSVEFDELACVEDTDSFCPSGGSGSGGGGSGSTGPGGG